MSFHRKKNVTACEIKRSRLILLSSSLAGFQLVKVPSANSHVALVLIQALAEVANVGLASRSLPRAVGGTALPQSIVHRLSLSGRRSLLGLSGGTAGGTTAEQAADGVSDRGTNCDTSCGRSHLAEESGTRALLNRGHRRRGLLSLRRRVSSSRVRLVVLSSGGSSRSCGSDSRSGGSAARRGRRRGGTTALTRHFGCVFSLEKK